MKTMEKDYTRKRERSKETDKMSGLQRKREKISELESETQAE